MGTEQNRSLLAHMFEAKKVPLGLLGVIGSYREFHRRDFSAVKDTVKAGVTLEEFDFYLEFVLDLVERLKPLWDV